MKLSRQQRNWHGLGIRQAAGAPASRQVRLGGGGESPRPACLDGRSQLLAGHRERPHPGRACI